VAITLERVIAHRPRTMAAEDTTPVTDIARLRPRHREAEISPVRPLAAGGMAVAARQVRRRRADLRGRS